MSDEFRLVTRKKWISRRSINNSRKNEMPDSEAQGGGEIDVDKFLKRFERLCTLMTNSDYYTEAVNTLEESLTHLTEFEKLQILVCFGIGPFTRTFQALHQLAFITSIRRHYKLEEAIYFDPVFNEDEKEILGRLNCTILVEDPEAKYKVVKRTLFYMPHCYKCLTNNLIWINWRPENLSNMILINNSFERITLSRPDRDLKVNCSYICDILPYTKEFAIEDNYEKPSVFNDLSVHVFPLTTLPACDDVFWESNAPPESKDKEILSNFIEKLIIDRRNCLTK